MKKTMPTTNIATQWEIARYTERFFIQAPFTINYPLHEEQVSEILS